MADAFEKFKSSINRSVAAMSVKTSASLEKAKLKAQIDTLTSDVQRMMPAVGEAFYLMWQRGDTDYSRLYEHLEVIRRKKEEIAALNAECAAIDQRNSQIMAAESKVPTASAMVAGNICPNCAANYAEGAKFCRKCGYKLGE